MKEIIAKIKSEKLCRCIDESGADGLWDYAYQMLDPFSHILMSDDLDNLAEEIYNALWEMYEIASGQDLCKHEIEEIASRLKKIKK